MAPARVAKSNGGSSRPREEWLESELERAHAFDDVLFDAAPAVILVLDRAGRIIRFNHFLEELTGYSLHDVVGKDWFETFLPPADRSRIRAVFNGALDGGDVRSHVNPIVGKDGELHFIQWDGRALTKESGEVLQVVSVGIDVTAAHRTEARMAHLEKRIRHSQKMEAIGTLTGGIAHDFNNVLMGVIGCIDLSLKRLEPDSPARAYLDEARIAAKRGASLTHQLLTFSRRRELEPVMMSVDAVINDAVTMLQTMVGEDSEVEILLGAHGFRVLMDPGLMNQMIHNLAVNARDSMPNGGSLSVETGETCVCGEEAERLGLAAGDYVRLVVTDTGAGIDSDKLGRVFEPFFTTKDVGQGTGLGLSTAYGIIEQAGGRIEVHSELGYGTSVRVYLPRAPTAPRLEPTGIVR